LTRARKGTTTIVTPGLSIQAGTVKTRVLPPPVGSTTTSGVVSASTARIALSCAEDLNDTLLCPSARCMARDKSSSAISPSELPIRNRFTGLTSSPTNLGLLAEVEDNIEVAGFDSSFISATFAGRSSCSLVLDRPRNECQLSLRVRKKSMDLTLRNRTMSIGTP
jgi:hypothetical protein